jgi:hypothetical protein
VSEAGSLVRGVIDAAPEPSTLALGLAALALSSAAILLRSGRGNAAV